jgi:hypothetical protein
MGFKEMMAGLRSKAEAEVAKRALQKAADGALDSLEAALLGKKGAADEILANDKGDGLDVVRATVAAQKEASERAKGDAQERNKRAEDEAVDREARARLELAELKRKMGKS